MISTSESHATNDLLIHSFGRVRQHLLGPGGVGPSIPANLNAVISALGSRSNFLSTR